jgi:hypothetical protein
LLQYLARTIPFPQWVAEGSRYWNLAVNDLFLQAKFYQHIPHAFCEETDRYNRYLKVWNRRPSVRLWIPSLGANLVSRKLFAGKHMPRVVHQNQKVLDALKWLIRTARLDLKMMEGAYRAQAGSVAFTFAVIDDVPVASGWAAQHCWPEFDDADQLENLMVAYCVTGAKWIELGATTDVQHNPINPEGEYWYVRIFDKNAVVTCHPIPYSAWNPVNGDEDLRRIKTEVPHDLGFVPAVWIKNLPGGDGVDGAPLAGKHLDDCIHIDYTCSQVGRGGNYASAPQLMVKGRILNYEKGTGGVHVMGPSQMLQLPADRKDGEQAVSGADAKIIEMNASGLEITMEKFVMHVKQWTQEGIGISRKDPNTITGTMSGKAMELIDEDFIDLVQVCRTALGEYGYLMVLKLLCLMCIKAAHAKFKGINEKMVDELELEWPNLFSPSPQEVQYLVTAITSSIDAGLIDDVEGRTWLEKQIDKRSTSIEGEPKYKPKLRKKQDIDADAAIKTAEATAKLKPKGGD